MRTSWSIAGSAIEDASVVLGGVNNAFDLRPIRDEMIENQVLLEMPDSPHPERSEFQGFVGCAEEREFSQFEEGATRLHQEAAGNVQAAIFTQVGEVPDKIAPSGRSDDCPAHL